MTFVSSTKNTEDLTLTFVAEFDAPLDRVWQVWEDPRQLERWWGPPTWPATFVRHDFVVGGQSHYFMTGPDGDKGYGWWEVTAIDAPHRLEFDDGFATPEWERDMALDKTHAVVTLEAIDGRTRMTSVSSFVSAEQLEQMAQMGMEEGMTQAIGQIDAILSESTAHSRA